VTLSLSPKVEDPAYRAVRFEDVVAAYTEQMVALRDGGVDLLLIETIFDTLNAKAAIAAAREAVPELPLWISFTAIDRSGRNLSGQTVEAFWISIEHARPLISGLEPFEIGPDTGFVMIGERTNVTGSARFRSLVEAGDYGSAVEVALEQVRGGANLLDVNMDADLLDAVEAMTTFLRLLASEPEVARIPI